MLYGIDLARREIARSSQAVVVEGYTDVMACHLSGVTTAVATCGTAFGEDHGRVIRRLLHDEDSRGEIIFTFDGDEAGQKAALRAFAGDQQFVAQTYVAVEPDGLDPCDLRLQKGDAAVRELVGGRTPLYRFVLDNVVKRYDLDRADGRRRVARSREARLVDPGPLEGRGLLARLASIVGVDMEEAAGRSAARPSVVPLRRAGCSTHDLSRQRPDRRRHVAEAQRRCPTCATRGSGSSARRSSSSSSSRPSWPATPATSGSATSRTRPTR